MFLSGLDLNLRNRYFATLRRSIFAGVIDAYRQTGLRAVDGASAATTFRRCVARYRWTITRSSVLSCLDQYLSMAFAQLTFRESLRDIEACLRAQCSKLYHLGIRATVARNTLANANATRDWRIYCDFAHSLIGDGATALCQRALWSRSERHRLRPRCHHDRSVPVGVSLGAVPFDQGGDQAAYAARSARQYPFLHSYQRWQVARGQRARSS